MDGDEKISVPVPIQGTVDVSKFPRRFTPLPPPKPPRPATRRPRPDYKFLRKVAQGVASYPAMSLQEIAEFTQLSVCALKKLVQKADDRCQPIPMFKEIRKGPFLLGPHAIHRLMQMVYDEAGWTVDRVGLLMWMAGASATYMVDEDPYPGKTKMKPRLGRRAVRTFYDVRAEREVQRIAALPEPARTIEGMMLLERWKEARKIAEGIVAGRQRLKVFRPVTVERLEVEVGDDARKIPVGSDRLARRVGLMVAGKAGAQVVEEIIKGFQ